jgi:hypothetical protein
MMLIWILDLQEDVYDEMAWIRSAPGYIGRTYSTWLDIKSAKLEKYSEL